MCVFFLYRCRLYKLLLLSCYSGWALCGYLRLAFGIKKTNAESKMIITLNPSRGGPLRNSNTIEVTVLTTTTTTTTSKPPTKTLDNGMKGNKAVELNKPTSGTLLPQLHNTFSYSSHLPPSIHGAYSNNLIHFTTGERRLRNSISRFRQLLLFFLLFGYRRTLERFTVFPIILWSSIFSILLHSSSLAAYRLSS